MFTKIGTVTVGITNQDAALAFYTSKLGFEVVTDQPMSETERWIEISLPDSPTHLMLGLRGQSATDHTGMTGYVLHTADMAATVATLKEQGVEITHEPSTMPWGQWAQFADLDGNEFGIWAPPV